MFTESLDKAHSSVISYYCSNRTKCMHISHTKMRVHWWFRQLASQCILPSELYVVYMPAALSTKAVRLLTWSLVCQTLFSGLLALRENKTLGEWQRQKLCVGDSQVCPGASTTPPFVLAFGQDDGGEVYLLGTSIPSYAPGVPATGVIYQVTDPARYCKPCTPTHKPCIPTQGI